MTLHHRGLLGTPCRPAAGLDPAPVEARRASYASRSRHGGSLRTSRAIRCNHRRDHVGSPGWRWWRSSCRSRRRRSTRSNSFPAWAWWAGTSRRCPGSLTPHRCALCNCDSVRVQQKCGKGGRAIWLACATDPRQALAAAAAGAALVAATPRALLLPQRQWWTIACKRATRWATDHAGGGSRADDGARDCCTKGAGP